MNKIKSIKIKGKVKELFLKANYHINHDLMKLLQQAQKKRDFSYRQICLKYDYRK